MNNKMLFLIVMTPFLVIALFLVDKMIKNIFENNHEKWKALGKPNGMFFHPPGLNGFSSSMTMSILFFKALFNSPKWITESEYLRKHMLYLRICVGFILSLGIIIFIV